MLRLVIIIVSCTDRLRSCSTLTGMFLSLGTHTYTDTHTHTDTQNRGPATAAQLKSSKCNRKRMMVNKDTSELSLDSSYNLCRSQTESSCSTCTCCGELLLSEEPDGRHGVRTTLLSDQSADWSRLAPAGGESGCGQNSKVSSVETLRFRFRWLFVV